MTLTVEENVEASRFELRDTDEDMVVGYATFSTQDDTVIVNHVQTDPVHRGRGYAAQLMAGLLDQLRSSNRKVTPVCSYAISYLSDNPDQHDLLA